MRLLFKALILALLVSTALPAVAAEKPAQKAAKRPSSDLCDLLVNSPAYVEGLCYSDYTSNTSIGANNPAGVGTVVLDLNGRSRTLSNALATLDVVLPGGDNPIIMSPGVSYPHGIRGIGTSSDLDAQWFTTFVATNVIACALDLKNKGATDLTLIPRVTGGVTEADNVSLGTTFDAQDNIVVFRSRESYRPSESAAEEVTQAYVGVMPGFLPKDCLLGESPSDLRNVWSLTGTKAAYIMTGVPFVLPAGQTRKLWMLVGVSVDGRDSMIQSLAGQVREMISVPSVEKAARRRANDFLEHLLDPVGDPNAQKLYYRSACTLRRNMGEPGGKFGKNHPCFADRTKSVVTPQDASMMAIALAEIDPAFAREQIQILTDNIAESGAIPEWISVNAVSPSPSAQPPLAAWAAWQVYQRKRDEKFLKQVFAPLCLWTEWWMHEHDRDFDNLCEPEGAFDPKPADQICDSARISSAVAVQMRSLAAIARALGRDAQAQSWTTRAAAMEQRMIGVLYDPNANLFFDAAINTHQLQKTISPDGLMPLWAAVPLPRSKESNMVRDYPMNPKRFFGAVPFADVPRDDPRFGPETRVTPLSAYLMMDTLRVVRRGRKGEGRSYTKEAQRASRQYLGFVARVGANYEFFDTAGNGYGTPESGVTAAVSLATMHGRLDAR